MPGIVGIISYEAGHDYRPLVEAMVGSMKHEQFYRSATYSVAEMGLFAGSIALDSAGEPQFLFNEQNDIILLLAGECLLDPRLGSRLQQRGHKLGDTASSWLVHLYEEEGVRFVENLNGLFSGLLIDQRQRKAFLFNDRYGSERIYWYENADAIYFASEAKALLSVLSELRTFDAQGVEEFLTYGCTLADRTLFKGVRTLPGSSLWSFGNRRCNKRKYFSPAAWETQPVLAAGDFMDRLQDVFGRVLPRYFESEEQIGISLTGGLDTRMIMACRRETSQDPMCYTFSGQRGTTLDDRIAARVATESGLEHCLLRLDTDFFSNFCQHVDRTVYLTDGCSGASGAHEVYLNKKASALAPVRLTGNYGSEILRGASTLKPLGLARDLLSPQLNFSTENPLNRRKNPVTFAAFTEIPSSLFGTLAAARSQLRFRTPYLDNEIVSLSYQAPETLRRSSLPAWQMIKANDPLLGQIPTDMGQSGKQSRIIETLRRVYSAATFKLDYLNNEGWPNWLSPLEPMFTHVTSALGIVGNHKYLHYRSWFRHELADYVRSAVASARAQRLPFWNQSFLETMADDHIAGRKNYVLEINAVLALEVVGRLFFREPPHFESSKGLQKVTSFPGHDACLVTQA